MRQHDLPGQPQRRERQDVRRQVGGGERLVPREAAEQPRDHQRRRVERQHVAEGRQQQRAGGHRRPAAQLRAVAAQDEAKRGGEAFGVPVQVVSVLVVMALLPD